MSPLIIGTNGYVAAINPATGEVRWQTSLDTGEFLSSTTHEDVSVLVRENIVYAGVAGHLYGLHADTGEILWHNSLSGLGHNDISLAMEGVSVQFVQKVQRQSS
ncbi:MAG: PQQ-like domain [Verrucomicrobia bacterium]|jgi:outer membrane protein assembly factor BamB|nr:PQQ-like domain [Verrucomicrobiota bacterium]